MLFSCTLRYFFLRTFSLLSSWFTRLSAFVFGFFSGFLYLVFLPQSLGLPSLLHLIIWFSPVFCNFLLHQLIRPLVIIYLKFISIFFPCWILQLCTCPSDFVSSSVNFSMVLLNALLRPPLRSIRDFAKGKQFKILSSLLV